MSTEIIDLRQQVDALARIGAEAVEAAIRMEARITRLQNLVEVMYAHQENLIERMYQAECPHTEKEWVSGWTELRCVECGKVMK